MPRDSKRTCSRIFTPVAEAQAILEQISKIFFQQASFLHISIITAFLFQNSRSRNGLVPCFLMEGPWRSHCEGTWNSSCWPYSLWAHHPKPPDRGEFFWGLFFVFTESHLVQCEFPNLGFLKKTHIDLLHNLFSPIKNGNGGIRGKVTAGVGNHTTVTGAFLPLTHLLLQILDLLGQPPKATRSRRFADAVTVLIEEIRIDMMIDVCAIGAHIHRFSGIASKKNKADKKKEYWRCGKENKKKKGKNTN